MNGNRPEADDLPADASRPICQLCGTRHPDGDASCTGPRITAGPRVLRHVELVSWGPELPAGYAEQARPDLYPGGPDAWGPDLFGYADLATQDAAREDPA